MKKNISFENIRKKKTASLPAECYSSNGLTMRLLEKYKPNRDLSLVKDIKERQGKRRAA